MKIATNIFDSPPTTGPGNFARRLEAELTARGVLLLPTHDHRAPTADIYFCSAFFDPHRLSYAKHRKSPTILRVDGLGAAQDFERVKWSYQNADVVIFQSEYSKNLFEQTHNYKHPNVYVIHNGIDLRNMGTGWANASSSKFVTICNTYNDVRWKHHKLAILNNLDAILSYNPRFQWVIAGKTEQIRSEVKRPAVTFVDYPADLDAVRTDAYACIHLVHQDSCPNSLIESMAYGLPSIVWKDSAGPELVGYFEAGVTIEDYKPETIVSAITTLSKNWIGMSDAAYRRVKNDMEIGICAERYLQCFQKSL
jgi:glycosyltransferase involved in cell wall biosynthesis